MDELQKKRRTLVRLIADADQKIAMYGQIMRETAQLIAEDARRRGAKIARANARKKIVKWVRLRREWENGLRRLKAVE